MCSFKRARNDGGSERGVGHLQRLMASLRPRHLPFMACDWQPAPFFEGPRGCWDYFRVYVAPVRSDLHRLSPSIKDGRLRITFIVFWKHVRVLLKTGFSGVCFLLTQILRIYVTDFLKVHSLTAEGTWIKANYFVTTETGVWGGSSSYLRIPANKSDLCVFNKTRVCFSFFLLHSQFLLIIDLGDPMLGVFFFIWHGQIFEV